MRQTNELQQAVIRILPDYDCMKHNRGDSILYQSKFIICAGSKDYQTDSCANDSGGPLMLKHNNRW
jgi:secreted trypsin-like serine protease